MTVITILILIILLFGGLLFICAGFREGEPWCLAIGLCMLIVFIWPLISHNYDIQTVIDGERSIKIKEERMESLRELISDPNNPNKENVILVNQDTPIAEITKELAAANKELMNTKEQILYAEKAIARRERGLTKYATWFISND